MNSNCTVHAHGFIVCERQSAQFIEPKTTLFRKKILKMGPMMLLTHLKITLLQGFLFLAK